MKIVPLLVIKHALIYHKNPDTIELEIRNPLVQFNDSDHP